MDRVTPRVAHERELEKEFEIAGNDNLRIILIFTYDFKPEMNWLSRALNAPENSIEETARILQGYGYLLIIKNSGKEYLQTTRKGNHLVLKLRSKLKAP